MKITSSRQDSGRTKISVSWAPVGAKNRKKVHTFAAYIGSIAQFVYQFIISLESKLLIMFRGQYVILSKFHLINFTSSTRTTTTARNTLTLRHEDRYTCIFFLLSLSIYMYYLHTRITTLLSKGLVLLVLTLRVAFKCLNVYFSATALATWQVAFKCLNV